MRCQARTIPKGGDSRRCRSPDGAVLRGRRLTANDRQKLVGTQDSGVSCRKIGQYLNRRISLVYSVAGYPYPLPQTGFGRGRI